MSFETVYFPMTGSNGEREVPERGQTVVRFWDAEMPALYAMSVRDQDESRGLVAFGNAFGELSLYDFSGSPANDLEGCFLGTAFPPLDATHTERAHAFAHASILDRPAQMLHLRSLPLAFVPRRLTLISFAFSRTRSTLSVRRYSTTMAAHATVDTSSRLEALRELMAKPEYNVQAVVVPTEDQRK